MLVKHNMYVAEKTQFEYMRDVRRACAEQSLPERLIAGVLASLRKSLGRVEFPEESAPMSLTQPRSDDSLYR